MQHPAHHEAAAGGCQQGARHAACKRGVVPNPPPAALSKNRKRQAACMLPGRPSACPPAAPWWWCHACMCAYVAAGPRRDGLLEAGHEAVAEDGAGLCHCRGVQRGPIAHADAEPALLWHCLAGGQAGGPRRANRGIREEG